jgi:D-3-phosphoglycerate dehydrogenase / 2-oxoglutarate reductase
MHYKILITHNIHPEAHTRLSKQARVQVLDEATQEGLIRAIADADALLVRMPVTPEAIRAGRKLRVVARHGVGLDYIPVATCTELRIPVLFTPDANTESVAEHVIATMIALAHHICGADRAVRQGRWSVRDGLMGIDIRGRTVGIVGFGRIGTRVAELCRGAFAMDVLAYDPHIEASVVTGHGAQVVSLERLLRDSDFVTLHAPATLENRHLIDARALAHMKRGSFLINHARGSLLDTAALTNALKSRHLGGAALDVLEQEPPARDLELLQLDNVIVTPHSAALTDEAMLRMGCDAGDDIMRVLRGEPPNACANPEVFRR